ncbi:hypothetical protein JAAARDRAFT_52042 [Jaapia argillacea MUCL 33604]|uniref:DDE Tnp4 domain-containing protein n=1 Tax=Jaapia argillacea MUCL 33604 TaxID=933084 RepID=A0A067QKI4_9AGAM|nr:hypothetical protein JAAARDRAFT_52042 [Jaapia argillacea MUCL 33604]
MLPNGIIRHLYGPMEGRRNDAFMLTESGLMEALAEFAKWEDVPDDGPPEERYFQVFGDPAYGIGNHLVSPFAIRIEVEHGFGIVSNTWPFLNAGWKMQLYHSSVGRYYRVGVLLTNTLNCLHPNQVAQYFDCQPPDLQDYFHEDT